MNVFRRNFSQATRLLNKMSSEWLVIVYDKPGSDRLSVRKEHLQKIPGAMNSGPVTSCGPMFTDATKTSFAGSYFTMKVDSKEEILAFLKEDPYAKADVWDLENVLAYPIGVAGRFPVDVITPPQ